MDQIEEPTLLPPPSHKSPIIFLVIAAGFFFIAGSLMLLSAANKQQKNIPASQAAELTALPTPTNSPGIPCPLFPADNIINRPVTDLPVDSNSNRYISTVGPSTHIATGFGRPYPSPTPFGFPYNVVPTDQPMLGSTQYPLQWIPESDPYPYPVPVNPAIQAPTDRHLLVVQQGNCKLYEFWHGYPPNQGATNEVTWDLFTNWYHTPPRNPNPNGGVTSADAAGLPILPLTFKYEEVMDAIAHRDPSTGVYPPVRHAVRTTMNVNRVIAHNWIWPAYHTDGVAITDPSNNFYPIPMGARIRLKADFPVTSYDPQIQVMLNTMKVYGLILADTYNGTDYSEFSIGGVPNNNWLDPGTFNEQIHQVLLSNFDVVDESGIMVANNSMQSTMPGVPSGTPAPSTTIAPSPTIPLPTATLIPSVTPTAVPTSIPTNTLTPVPTVTNAPTPTPDSVMWQGAYFNDRRVSNQWVHLDPARVVLTRNDSLLNFNWGHGSPDSLVTSDHFSARWTKQVNLTVGSHMFSASHDDGARIYLDGVLIYNYWSNQSASNRNFIVNITNSGLHDLRVEYYENTGNASLHLSWQ